MGGGGSGTGQQTGKEGGSEAVEHEVREKWVGLEK
jgi:hypothetical protein